MNLLAELRRRVAFALEAVDPAAVRFAEMVLPSQDAKFGDYQANCAMPLGKLLGKPPRAIAEQLLEKLDVGDLCAKPEIAGPGFINLRIRDDWLAGLLGRMLVDETDLGIEPAAQPRTFVIDYSSPNVAKPMHVGHIRSTVIGDALAKVLRQLGHRVITDNHIGDWGTQFGMIIFGFKNFADQEALRRNPVAELSRVYRLVNALIEDETARHERIPAMERSIVEMGEQLQAARKAATSNDPKEQRKEQKRIRQVEGKLADLHAELDSLRLKVVAIDEDPVLLHLSAEHQDVAASALAETAALHAGDPTNRGLWERFLPACLDEMQQTYDRLGVSFDHTLGESYYHDRLAGVVDDLCEKGIAVESEGARCVFLEGFDSPLIVQKKDGAFLYATTDLATVAYRMKTWSPDAILYVVDHRQSLHFELLFATVRRWGYGNVELEHVSFGTVLGEDGRPYKTRSGSAVGLTGLLDEAVERALKIVSENDDARDAPLLSAEERLEVARRVGIGAIKYADLAHNRTSDYVFNYDKMLAMQGNTAAYMQYSYARVCSIFGKGEVELGELRSSAAPIELSHPEERALALALVQFSEALDRVAEDYRPNHLTGYLFDLASRYSSFFENCPVLKADADASRTSRLKLCDLTARTLARGLNLLGIEVVERM